MRLFNLEDEEVTFLRYVGTNSPIDTASCHRRTPLPPLSNEPVRTSNLESTKVFVCDLCQNFSVFTLNQRAQMHEYQDAVRVLRYRKIRYN